MTVAVMYDEIAASLRVWFIACFGFAAMASAVAIALKLHLLVHTVRARRSKASKTNPMDKRLDEVRLELRAIYCYVLLTIFEDIPLGSLNLAYLRLRLMNSNTTVKIQSTTGAILTMATTSSTFFIIGYNFRQILGIAHWWTCHQTLIESSAVLERARATLQRHSLKAAVRKWRAACILQVPLQVCESTDLATKRGSALSSQGSAAVAAAGTLGVANDSVEAEGEAGALPSIQAPRIQVPSDVTKRNSLSVLWDGALNTACVTMQHHQDIRTVDGDPSPQAKRASSASSRTLALHWDETKDEAVLSSRLVSNSELPLAISSSAGTPTPAPASLQVQWDETPNQTTLHLVRSPELPRLALPEPQSIYNMLNHIDAQRPDQELAWV